MNPKFFLLFAVFGCPLLSKLIYGGIKYSNEQSKRKELENQYQQILERQIEEKLRLYSELKSRFIHDPKLRTNIYNELLFLSRTIEEKNENWEEDLDKYTSLKELFDTLMEEYKKYFNIDKTCNKCEYYIRDQETVCPFCKTKIKK